MKAKLDFGGQVVEVELRAMSEKPKQYTYIVLFRNPSRYYDVIEGGYFDGRDRFLDGRSDIIELPTTDYLGWIPEPIITVEE